MCDFFVENPRTERSRCVCEICITTVHMLYHLFIIYGGKGLEETLMLSTRKSHEAVFDMLLWILMTEQIKWLIYDFSFKTSRRMVYVLKCHILLLYNLYEISCYPCTVRFEDPCASCCLANLLSFV